MATLPELLEKLKRDKGAIVLSNRLTHEQIACCQAAGAFYVDSAGFGFAQISDKALAAMHKGEPVVMDDEAIKAACVQRLRYLYPEPWFVWWGIGAGVHCGEAVACVRTHGTHTLDAIVSESLPIAELLDSLLKTEVIQGLDQKCRCGHKRREHYDYDGRYCNVAQCECNEFNPTPAVLF